ncbi:hypothetical protein F511_34895 [Dorcoceras hygrometricum]|uniref:Uncharacterized protein n=1 Tax=Dorcoceras hygrometricum TaxID=472368 RepID=A0A2Z7AEE4_9LAMI|nr:hypothetical protein F511_34895 [Dorcoceras hygrometricum]
MTRYNIYITGTLNTYGAPLADASLGPTDLPEKPTLTKHTTKSSIRENKQGKTSVRREITIQQSNTTCNITCCAMHERYNKSSETKAQGLSWQPYISVATRHIRQSGPRPDSGLLRQTALEVLTRSARWDSPRRVGRKQISGDNGAAVAAAQGGGGGGVEEEERGGGFA